MESVRNYFSTKLNKTSGRNIRGLGECWIWTGNVNHNRGTIQTDYCKYTLKETYAHRVAYIIFKGSIPDGKQVNHLCEDKPGEHYLCCNPDHLSSGSQAENIIQRDLNLGSYQPKGADSNNAKFSLEEARAIQQRHLKGEEYKDIATSLKVNRRTIERICIGDTYKELGDIRPLIKKQNEDNDKKIIEMNKEGKCRKEICEKCKRSPSYVSGIITRSNTS